MKNNIECYKMIDISQCKMTQNNTKISNLIKNE